MAFDFTQFVFFFIAVYILLCIVMVLRSEKVMQSAYWLILMLIGVSILFLLANSEILFVFQLSIYSGGIAVLLLFAAVLTEHDELGFDNSLLGFVRATFSQFIVYIIFAANIIFLVLNSVLNSAYPQISVLGDTTRTYAQAWSQITGFATYLWDDMAIVIIILGLLVLTAILGSVKLAIREEELEDLSEEVLLRLKGEEVLA